MTPDQDPETEIEAGRGFLVAACLSLFLWGVALGYASRALKELIACL